MVTVSGSARSAYPPDSSGDKESFVQQLMDIHPSAGCIFKRFIDILGACVGLVLLLPVAIGVAIANILYSPGPLFYRQVRCG